MIFLYYLYHFYILFFEFLFYQHFHNNVFEHIRFVVDEVDCANKLAHIFRDFDETFVGEF